MAVHLFSAYVAENKHKMILAVFFWGGLIFLRYMFTPQSPRMIEVDKLNMALTVYQRFPMEKTRKISLLGFKNLKTRILKSKFPLIEVELIFEDRSSEKINFRTVGRGGFFSFPEEGAPQEVIAFTEFILNGENDGFSS